MADRVSIDPATLARIEKMAHDAGVDLRKVGQVPGDHVTDALIYGMGAVKQQPSRSHPLDQQLSVDHIWFDEFAKIDAAACKRAREVLNGGLASQIGKFTSTPPKTLKDYSDAELIMEMLGRGFAAMKIPHGEVLT